MDDSFDASITDAVERLQAAHEHAPSLETDRALARLESTLFGAPSRPRTLDRYPLLRTLGQGGSGVVYLAYDPRLDRKVAIKVLSRSLVPRRGSMRLTHKASARLLREAQAMARSPHPNVVAVYDVGTLPSPGTGEESVFIVMEHVEGPDLARWLSTRHPWREVVEVMVAAGRGLAAAHEVGVIHRDFKPANAIVGDDGRVRVLDFGLARGLDRGEVDTETLDVTDPTGSPRTSLDLELTEDGAVIGTPAYMAPEQHAGHTADAATDQFSFCVTLWEGVLGERPYAGRSFEQLLAAKLGGPPRAPGGRDVPGWLVAVMQRGLQPERADRWPSMAELLEALTQGLGQRRRRMRALLATGVVASLGTLGGLALADDSAPRCEGAEERLAEVWGPARRARLVAAFAATGRSYATSTLEGIEARLDELAHGWAEQRQAACEATVVHAEQSDAMMDLRMACLDRQLRGVDAMLAVLEEIDATTLDHAFEAADAVPRPEDCGDTEALLAAVPPPGDPELARAVEQQRDRLARVQALTIAGRIPEARSLAQAVTTQAEALGYEPLLAEALTERGSLEEHDGAYEQAEQTLEHAHAVALGCGHDPQAARASQRLVFVTGDRRRRLEDALRWARISEAEHARAGLEAARAPLLLGVGTAYQAAGRFEEAKRSTLEALELLEAPGSSQPYLVPTAHLDLGELLRSLGERSAAREHLERAQALWVRELGPDHPNVAMVLHDLGTLDLDEGDEASATQRFARAVEIREAALGLEHPLLATSLSNLGVLQRRQGRLAEARESFERAAAILRSRGGPDAPDLAPIETNLAVVDREEGDFAAADEHLRRALELQAGSEHPHHAITLHDHALNLVSLGRVDEALEAFERAQAINAAVYGSGHELLAQRRMDLAEHLHEAGATALALPLARAARAQLPPDADPALREAIESWLAEVDQGYPGPGE